MAEQPTTRDLLVVGSGAAGLAAAVYAGRYKLDTLVLGAEFGGETAVAGSIENYPGIAKIDGYQLMSDMKAQAQGTGAEVAEGRVASIARERDCFVAKTEKGEEHRAASVILALGAERRRLNLEREQELTGKGVHYCWTCDGPLYGKKTVGMVGGGDSSVKGINFLSEYADKLYLIVRDPEVAAEPVNLERMKALGDKVEVLLENEVKAFNGKERLESVTLTKEYKGSAELRLDGLFVEIGFDPDVELAVSLGAELDEHGYMKTDNMMRTNVPGLLGAGDAVNLFGEFKQDITAAAMGAVAATSAYEYVRKNGPACAFHQKPVQ